MTYMESLEQQKLSRCPEIDRRLAGDETYDICKLNGKACLIEHGIYECEIWDEIQKEWIEEKAKDYKPPLRIVRGNRHTH